MIATYSLTPSHCIGSRCAYNTDCVCRRGGKGGAGRRGGGGGRGDPVEESFGIPGGVLGVRSLGGFNSAFIP